jgi:uncharacterized membrane protein YphA (DoxX/SURF4 family)
LLDALLHEALAPVDLRETEAAECWARLGALGLLGFTVIATLLAHGIQGLTGEKRQQQETTTFEHLAIVGGFLFVVIHGAVD